MDGETSMKYLIKFLLVLFIFTTFLIIADAQSQRVHSKNSRIQYDYRNTLVHRRYRKAAEQYFLKYTLPKTRYNIRQARRSTAYYRITNRCYKYYVRSK